MGANLGAFRPPRRAKNGGDEPSLAIEHDDGLKAVFVVMGVEQAQLLAAMHGVEGIVDIKNDPLRHLPERAAIKIGQGTAHAQQAAPIRQVLQPRDRRLRA